MDLFDALSHVFLEYGYFAVFGVLVLCGLGLPLPEELTLIAAGVVVYEGRAHLGVMTVVAVFGILAGDSLLFALGRRYGPHLLQRRLFSRLLHAERMSKVRRQFDLHGVKAVFFARFFAGIRAPVYFTAGTLGMRYRSFAALDLLGALLSAPISVWLGYHFGAELERLLVWLARFDRILLLTVIGVVLWIVARKVMRWRERSKEDADKLRKTPLLPTPDPAPTSAESRDLAD